MGRILALDYGTKRIGLAISDETKVIAQCLPALAQRSQESAIAAIAEIVKKDGVEKLLVGLPVNLQGKDTPQTKLVRDFKQKLSNALSLEIEFQDERFSTRQAKKILAEHALRALKSRELIDSMSAYVILENYLQKQKN